MKACAEADASNSSHVIDIMAGLNLEHAHYLKGCVLARFEGRTPEIQPGTPVTIEPEKTVRGNNLSGYSNNTWELVSGNYTVDRVWYFKNNWYLELRGHICKGGGVALYPADQFTVVTIES